MSEKSLVIQSPAELMTQALEKGLKPEQLEKMLEIQERWEANQARKAFANSMVKAQSQMPIVPKALFNPQTHSKYADLSDVIQKAKPIYTKHGFSTSFYEGDTPKQDNVRVCVDVTHKLGCKESHFYDVPLDGKGIQGKTNMTAIHAKASSVKYGQRYLMCLIWNIPTGDDNDGNNTEVIECITDDEAIYIKNQMADVKGDMGKLLKFVAADKVENILKSKYAKALKLIADKKKGSSK